MTTPITITIFVRHTPAAPGKPGCKYAGDEFAKRCNCRKHLRWTANGEQHRRTAGTRSWTEAERIKRDLEDQLSGRAVATPDAARALTDAIAVFLKDKTVQGVTADVLKKYTRLLGRLQTHCESRNVFTVQGITRDVITDFCATWKTLYPSSLTRAKLRERLRSFLRYCYEAQWLERVPPVTKFKIAEPETQPLTPEEYKRLLAAVPVVVGRGDPRRQTNRNNGRRPFENEEILVQKVRAFLQCMRWTGLAIRDSLTLRRDALTQDGGQGLYRVTTKRAKTGTPVSVPIPSDVAAELLAVSNANPGYFFWSGKGEPQSATSNWGQRYIAPVFKAAKVYSDGNMLSHRLRDTFAVDLLTKGVPMEEVSRLLGHTSIRTTEKSYAKWSKGRQDRADALVTATWAVKTRHATRKKSPKTAA
jgi:integrase/recombinase XerD